MVIHCVAEVRNKNVNLIFVVKVETGWLTRPLHRLNWTIHVYCDIKKEEKKQKSKRTGTKFLELSIFIQG